MQKVWSTLKTESLLLIVSTQNILPERGLFLFLAKYIPILLLHLILAIGKMYLHYT